MKALFAFLLLSTAAAQNFRSREIVRTNITGRIVGGNVATPGRYSYFALSANNANSPGGCGGSLLLPDVVMTAAHCINSFRGDQLYVGIEDKNDLPDQVYRIRRQVSHPDFRNDNTFRYDLKLLFLEQAVTGIPPVRLGEGPDPPNVLTVVGFGNTRSGGSSSDILLEVSVPTATDNRCLTQYGGSYRSDIMYCAGQAGLDSCQGDSGGPMVDAAGRQVGIVSFGNGCGGPDFFGVYTRISRLRGWIEDEICAGSTFAESFGYCGASSTPAPVNPPPTPATPPPPTPNTNPPPTPSPPTPVTPTPEPPDEGDLCDVPVINFLCK